MDPRRAIQIVAMTLSLVSLILVISRAYYGSRFVRCVLVAPVVFLLHSFIYYVVLLLSSEAIDLDHIILGKEISFHAWAGGMSLHAIITIIFLVYAMTKTD